jgi:hypothetical protein
MADRRDRQTVVVNNNAQGWGAAAFIVLLAILCVLGALYLRTQTYRHPRYPTPKLEHTTWQLPAELPARTV